MQTSVGSLDELRKQISELTVLPQYDSKGKLLSPGRVIVGGAERRIQAIANIPTPEAQVIEPAPSSLQSTEKPNKRNQSRNRKTHTTTERIVESSAKKNENTTPVVVQKPIARERPSTAPNPPTTPKRKLVSSRSFDTKTQKELANRYRSLTPVQSRASFESLLPKRPVTADFTRRVKESSVRNVSPLLATERAALTPRQLSQSPTTDPISAQTLTLNPRIRLHPLIRTGRSSSPVSPMTWPPPQQVETPTKTLPQRQSPLVESKQQLTSLISDEKQAPTDAADQQKVAEALPAAAYEHSPVKQPAASNNKTRDKQRHAAITDAVSEETVTEIRNQLDNRNDSSLSLDNINDNEVPVQKMNSDWELETFRVRVISPNTFVVPKPLTSDEMYIDSFHHSLHQTIETTTPPTTAARALAIATGTAATAKTATVSSNGSGELPYKNVRPRHKSEPVTAQPTTTMESQPPLLQQHQQQQQQSLKQPSFTHTLTEPIQQQQQQQQPPLQVTGDAVQPLASSKRRVRTALPFRKRLLPYSNLDSHFREVQSETIVTVNTHDAV